MNAQERAKAVSRKVADELKPYFVTHDELHEFKIRHVDASATPIYAPSVITSRGGSWQVRSRATGQVHHLQYSMGRIINVISCLKSGAKPPASCGAELEYVQKALSDASSSNGGTLIPQEWVDFVIPELGAQTVVLKANPNVIPMQHDIINLPGFGSAAAIQWLAEAASSTESSPGTTNIQLQLHTARLLTAASREWMQDATPETDSALQANLVRTMARGVDLAFLAGTGSAATSRPGC
jgi:HK97 family phage major capsid protein